MRRLVCGLGLVLAILASFASLPQASAASSLSVTAPSSLTGGRTLSLTVRLPKAATAATTVGLASSDRGAVPIASSVEIPARRSLASLSVRTKSVDQPTAVTITVSVGSTEKTAVVTVLPAKLTTLSTAATVVGGVAARGTVSRDVASTYPTTVTLTSKDPAVASVPATVTIKANAASASFSITTIPGAAGSALITASAGGKSVTDTTRVTLARVSRISVVSSLGANTSRSAKVYLDGPAPAGGLVVSLASSDAAVSVPATVTVARGQTEGTFQVQAGSPAATTRVTLTARLAGVAVTKVTTVAAGPQPVAVASVDGMPASLAGGARVDTVTVVLTRAATSATTVGLTSGDPSALGVPASVVVPAGRTSAAFTVSAGAVVGATDVAVTATLPGGSKRATVTVLPATLVAVETTAELAGGSAAAGTVTLAGTTPAGAVVKLSSSDPNALQIPEAVELVPGVATVAFTVTTGIVAEATKVEIVATYGDQAVGFVVVVLPAPAVGPAAFDPALFAYTPDAETVLTLLLTGPAPAEGLTVELAYAEGVRGEGKVWVEPGVTSVAVPFRVASGAGAVWVVAYANDTKVVAEGAPAETTATLSLERTTVTGGEAIVATYRLSAPAGPEGQTVVIESDSAGVVPAAKAWLAPGESVVTFKLETYRVKRETVVSLSVVDGPAASATVTISASVREIEPMETTDAEVASGATVAHDPEPAVAESSAEVVADEG